MVDDDTPIQGKDKKKHKGKTRGSARGVETMLRTAYRTNLDLTTLADSKANMLISINAIILSVIMAMGGLSIAVLDNRVLLLPMLSLVLTSFVSLVCAILVARPRVPLNEGLSLDDFHAERANILFFGQSHKLQTAEFLVLFEDALQDHDKLYRLMALQLHNIIKVLAAKYRLLNWSYTIFIAGITVTVILFLAVYLQP